MPTLMIELTDEEYSKARLLKAGRTWKDVILGTAGALSADQVQAMIDESIERARSGR